MKIERRIKDRRENSENLSQLEEVANPPAQNARVCDPSCEEVCPTCGATACACACSSECRHIPGVLTDDPNFPIEAHIAPLAFELKRLGIFRPCWSCEGHNDTQDTLWKIPRVWFYCDSVVHLRLLSDVLKDLEIEEKLHVPWQVAVTFSDAENPDTTFSLKPARTGPGTKLEDLQADTRVITENVYDRVTAKAGQLISGG